ncbi:MAG: hypothetical protein QM758_12905 [Armatimonas sp.]
MGAVTWLKAGQKHSHVVSQKRIMAIVCIASAFSVPISSWPLYLSFLAARPAMDQLAAKTTLQMAKFSYEEHGDAPIQINLNPPVRCGLLKIEVVGLDWAYPDYGCFPVDDKDVQPPKLRASQLWVNRDGYGPTFLTESDGRLRAYSVVVPNTPAPHLMLRR